MKTNPGWRLKNICWALLLVALPFTSFPILASLLGGTAVAPLSALFLFVLMLAAYLPDVLKHRSIPRQALPLILFLLAAIFSSALANFFPIESFRGASVWKNALEGILTVFLGLAFYLVTIQMLETRVALRDSLKWIYLGGLITITASMVQAGFWHLRGGYPTALKVLQWYLTSSGKLFRARVTGVAFEPSWLANQLNTLYLPLWLGFSVTGYSAFKRKLFGIFTAENILLGLGIVTLFLSFSRIGWLTTLAMVAFLVFRAADKSMNAFLKKRAARAGGESQKGPRFLVKLGLWLGLILAFGLIILLLGVFFSRIDPRMKYLFDLERYRKFGVLGWASKLSFAERIIYWITAFRVFLLRPFFGVGLGGSGFFFARLTPEFGYSLPEVVRYLFSENVIPNAKNLWVRLLSETGIVGFSLFCAWLFSHWHTAQRIEKQGQDKETRTYGLVGKLFIIAILMEGFSMDSFGLPYIWIAAGLIITFLRISTLKSETENPKTAP